MNYAFNLFVLMRSRPIPWTFGQFYMLLGIFGICRVKQLCAQLQNVNNFTCIWYL